MNPGGWDPFQDGDPSRNGNGHHTAPNAPAPAPVPPMPLPTAWNLQPVRTTDGTPYLQVTVSTPGGTAVFFVDPDAAERLAQMFKDIGAMARSGLILPD